MNADFRGSRLSKYICATCVLTVVGVALYFRTLGFEYVWDDSLLFLDKTALINDPLTWKLLAEPVLPGTSYFRPLIFLSLYIEFHLFGQSAALSHGVNLVIYLLNVLLVFELCRRIVDSNARGDPIWLGLIAALIYAVHPALVESTAWVAGRFDLTVTAFILAASIVYLGAKEEISNRRIFVVLIFFSGALLSKELGVILPAVIFFLWCARYSQKEESGRVYFWRGIKANAKLMICMVIVSVGYLMLRKFGANGIYHTPLSWDYIRAAVLAEMIPLEAMKFYFAQVLFPFGQVNPLHPLKDFDLNGGWNRVSSYLIFAGVVSFCAWTIYRKSPAKWVFWAGAMGIVPVLHFVPMTTGGNIGHERFLTLPLAFFSISIVLVDYRALAAKHMMDRKIFERAVFSLGVGWFLIALWTTHSILPFWASDLQLWNWAYRSHPNFEFGRYNYLYGSLKAGRFDLVSEEIEGLRKKNGGLDIGEQILYANLLLKQGDPEAMQFLRGVMYALPPFHERPDGLVQVLEFPIQKNILAGAYGDYAIGAMLFEGEAEKALRYSEISEWYLARSEQISLLYSRVAIFAALNRFDDVERLVQYLEPLRYIGKRRAKMDSILILANYCKVSKNTSEGNCGQSLEKLSRIYSSNER